MKKDKMAIPFLALFLWFSPWIPVHSAEMPGIAVDTSTQTCVTIYPVETNRWYWTNRAFFDARLDSAQHGLFALLLSLPVMVPLVILAVPADLLARPFRHLEITVPVRIQGVVIGPDGRPVPNCTLESWVWSYRRRCTDMDPCQSGDANKIKYSETTDDTGAFDEIVGGRFDFNDYFDVHFEPPNNCVLRVIREKDGRVLVGNVELQKEICPLRIRALKNTNEPASDSNNTAKGAQK